MINKTYYTIKPHQTRSVLFIPNKVRPCYTELHSRVPSLLDAVTYWYALRAQGDKLDDSSAFDKTYIRHFDLEPKTVDGWSLVPYSCVGYDGGPDLTYSSARRERGARLAVGKP